MATKAELQAMVAEQLAGTYATSTPRTVPLPEAVPLGKKASLLTATALFMDLRQSSDITNSFRRQTAAKMLKAYFDGAVRIVNGRGGAVRSFNGDGMLALFIGDTRTTDAVRAAMEVEWFVTQILWPRFDRYFNADSASRGAPLKFSVGYGIDDGDIYAVKVGIRGTNDVAWVGRCTNTAAKLSGILDFPHNIGITAQGYSRLNKSAQNTIPGDAKWSAERAEVFGGVRRRYRVSDYYREIG
ncbi:MAG: hypothetical protein QOJ81_759 [Chloroflexota bacterium]|jgi:class 3 adenylate cyclase|nr:hypothetical protein [Chloroflexota bacterium]